MTLNEFFNNLTQDILARSGASETFTRTAFLEYMCSKLEEEGFISSFDLTEHKISAKGQAVDAWSFDDERSRLTLFLGDYRSSGEVESLTKTDVTKLFKRLINFVDASMRPDFAESLEEADPVSSLAWLISERGRNIQSVHLVLLSNAALSSKVTGLPTAQISDFTTSYDIWDLGRIFRMETSGKSREDVEIDFSRFSKAGVPCLPAYTGAKSLPSYLLVMPGKVLAELYGEYGERLLEQNVRTFLQFRGKINKGIRNTLFNEPEMFFSYNNGLSATAEKVVTDKADRFLLNATNLQIVNGGQTTASIFAASRESKPAGLENVYVQIKLSVVDPKKAEVIVPKISEFSNTQNKVNAADFFSNHPFHLRIEEFSRRLWAPSPQGGVKETHWFYERARGQFADKQSKLSDADRKKFLLQNPRDQMFTKTDLAKFVLSFEELPHEVSLGAQKAFAGNQKSPGFVGIISKEWEKNNVTFNELWFKQAVAKAIVFRDLDRRILKENWYRAYKANIVTYTIAKFASLVRFARRNIDFMQIWQKQKLPEVLLEQLVSIAEVVNEMLSHPPAGFTSNIGEWAKKAECWEIIQKRELPLSTGIEEIFIDSERKREDDRDGERTQIIQDSIHAQASVVNKGAAYWAKLLVWNEERQKLTESEVSILTVACSMPRRIPSDKQAAILIRAEQRAINEGFFSAD
jgi:hypothetical protein